MKTESADEFASRKKTITDDANSALVKTAATMKHFYDRKHTGRETPVYEPGRLVWLEAVNIQLTRPSKKLDDRRLGPFTVLEKVGQRAYRLQLPSSWCIHPVFHTTLLRPYDPPSSPLQQQPDPPPPIVVGDHLEQEVETILDECMRCGCKEYLVKWKGLPREENSWEPHSHLEDEDGINEQFWKYLQDRGEISVLDCDFYFDAPEFPFNVDVDLTRGVLS